MPTFYVTCKIWTLNNITCMTFSFNTVASLTSYYSNLLMKMKLKWL